MLRFTAAVSVVAILASTGAFAQAPAASPAPPASELKVKKVCKSEPVVGSRFVKKTCHTPEEWAAIQQNDRRVLEGYQQNACRAGAGGQSGGIQC